MTVKEFLEEMANAGFDGEFVATNGTQKITGNIVGKKVTVTEKEALAA